LHSSRIVLKELSHFNFCASSQPALPKFYEITRLTQGNLQCHYLKEHDNRTMLTHNLHRNHIDFTAWSGELQDHAKPLLAGNYITILITAKR
jgi:hypothetical protein